MPLFGLFCMVIFLYVISKIFGGGSFCNRYNPRKDDSDDLELLKKEIQELRREIKTLRDAGHSNKKENGNAP